MKPIPLAPSSIDRSDRFQRVLGVVSLAAAAVATLFTAYFSLNKAVRFEVAGVQQAADLVQAQKALSAEVDAVRAQLKQLQSETQKITALPSDAKLAIQLSQIQNGLQTQGIRLEKLGNR